MNRNFIRINWIALVLIYLVVIAGSVVRTSGSGMGCPDWPKCFGKWVPPTEIGQLPENYKEIYGQKRVKKVEKFANFLTFLGMKETAEKIKNDPATYEDESFNPARTWTEYVNRLVGFLAGNFVLLIAIWSILKYRKHKNLVFWTVLNLILIGIEGWFGSIVVATNLVPWTITVHLFLAFVIIAIQLKIIRLISPKWSTNFYLTKQLKWLIS
jgi:cytochrome c oxidase assembly protein subunit 15